MELNYVKTKRRDFLKHILHCFSPFLGVGTVKGGDPDS